MGARGLRLLEAWRASERLQRNSAHHALERSVGQTLSASRTALVVVIATCLLSKESHRVPPRLDRCRTLEGRCRTPAGPCIKRPRLCAHRRVRDSQPARPASTLIPENRCGSALYSASTADAGGRSDQDLAEPRQRSARLRWPSTAIGRLRRVTTGWKSDLNPDPASS